MCKVGTAGISQCLILDERLHTDLSSFKFAMPRPSCTSSTVGLQCAINIVKMRRYPDKLEEQVSRESRW